jgi:hypothetical protein
MTKVQLNKFKRVLVSSIKKHLKSGGRLIAGDFFLGDHIDDTNCRCPIQTVMGTIGSEPTATSALLSKEFKPLTNFQMNKIVDKLYV